MYKFARMIVNAVAGMAVLLAVPVVEAQPPRAEGSDPDGLSINDPKAFPGYTLIFPMNSTSTYLIDMEGRIVQQWKSDFTPALSAYLLPNGHLLRPAAERGPMAAGPGSGGRIQEFDWDGELVWDYSFSSDTLHPHHDICPLPNGNVLVTASDVKTAEQAIAAGRRPETVREQLVSDCILEIKPTGRTTGEIVWQWHAWDHLIQDVDKDKPNYGDVSEHPERIDINFGSDQFSRMLADPQQLARLRSLGYVGGGAQPAADQPPAAGGNNPQPDPPARVDRPRRRGGPDGPGGGTRGPMSGDWLHTNAVAYNAELDQIMLSIHGFSEVWIIEHGTTTAEAASNSGARRGKGGDLLYRWGNPQAYRSGSNVDQRLFSQHNAHWIPAGLPGAGNMLVFNNGGGRPDGSYSSVDEIVLPLTADGTYAKVEFVAFGPERARWSYSAPDKSRFFSALISGAQRLANGNTLICSGNEGKVFEVTPDQQVVWQYKHPGAEFGPGGFPRPGEVLNEFLQQMLGLDEHQRKALAALQAEVDQKLKALLTDQQRQTLADMQRFAGGPPGGGRGFGPPFFGGPGFGPPGPDGDGRGVPGPDGRGPGRRGPDGRGPDGPGRGGPGFGGPGFGGPGRGPGGLFRSQRYALDYPAFDGQTLTPGEKLAEVAR